MKAYLTIVLDEVTRVLEKIDDASSRAFVRELARCKSIYITGVGRSGLVVQAFGQRLMHLGFDVHLAHEITAPAIRRGDLLVACSGTGTTLLPHYMARKARRIHARVVCLTARPNSPLARISHLTVPIPAPLERGPETRQPCALAIRAGAVPLPGLRHPDGHARAQNPRPQDPAPARQPGVARRFTLSFSPNSALQHHRGAVLVTRR